jgi:hypothetical protein
MDESALAVRVNKYALRHVLKKNCHKDCAAPQTYRGSEHPMALRIIPSPHSK